MHLSGIDANLLVALDALLQERSVTRAARRMGLTQSAMSHALARLRRHLADPLLVRVGRSMTRTPRADALVEPLHRLVMEMEQVFAAPPPFDPRTLRRTFRLGTSDHAGLLLLPRLEAQLAAAPLVALHLPAVGTGTPQALGAGELDAALTVFRELPADLRSQDLYTDRLVCLVRRGHPAVAGGLSLDQYVSLPHVLVAPRGTLIGTVDDALRALGLRRHVARIVPQFLLAPFLVARSDAVLTVSERLAREMTSVLPLTLHEPPLALPTFTMRMVWHERNQQDPAHTWLRGALARAAALLPGLDAAPAPDAAGTH